MDDLTSPIISNTNPSGVLSYGTTSANLTLNTNENSTCLYTYDGIEGPFSTTGTTNHSTTVSGLEDGESYFYLISCYDSSGNYSEDTTVSFSIAQDDDSPSRSNGSPSGKLKSSTKSVTLNLSTDENATCKYSTVSGIEYTSIANTFSITGERSHQTTISGLKSDKSYTYYVRCQDLSAAQNTNNDDYPISFYVNEKSSGNDDDDDDDDDNKKSNAVIIPPKSNGGLTYTYEELDLNNISQDDRGVVLNESTTEGYKAPDTTEASFKSESGSENKDNNTSGKSTKIFLIVVIFLVIVAIISGVFYLIKIRGI